MLCLFQIAIQERLMDIFHEDDPHTDLIEVLRDALYYKYGL